MRVSRLVPNKPIREDVEFNFSKEHMSEIMDLSKTETQRQAALELIAFQNDGFFEKVSEWVRVNLFEPLNRGGDASWDTMNKRAKALVTENDLEKKFNALIFERLGVRLETYFYDINPGDFACFPPSLIATPVMFASDSDYSKEARPEIGRYFLKESIDKGSGKIKGTVDLKRAKLGGFYSTITATLYMDVALGVLIFTPEEFTAICLHELGHIFFGMEFAFRTQYACQVLAHLHQVKTSRDSEKIYDQEVQVCLETLKEGGIIHKDLELEAEVQTKDEKVVQTLILAHTWSKLSYDYGNDRSAAPNFEVLADNFAIRFGAGSHLISALEKLGLQGIKKNDFLTYYEGLFTSIMTGGVFGFLFKGLSLFNFAAFAGVGLFVFMFKLLYSGEHKTGNIATRLSRYKNEYDDDYTRFVKIREGLIRQLKEGRLNPQQKKIVLVQIDDINLSLKNFKKKEDLLDDIANFIFKDRKMTAQFMKTQRQLEKLADNELFVGSQKLKTLSL